MIYVLVILVYSSSKTAMDHAEFLSESACKKAGEAAVSEFSEFTLSSGVARPAVRFICAPKG